MSISFKNYCNSILYKLHKGHFEVCWIAKQNAASGFVLHIIKSAECLARVTLLWFFLDEIGLRYYYCVLMKFLLLYFAHGNTLKKIYRRPGVMIEQWYWLVGETNLGGYFVRFITSSVAVQMADVREQEVNPQINPVEVKLGWVYTIFFHL
jgi:hypothetical protein